jgi:hypothetical protein
VPTTAVPSTEEPTTDVPTTEEPTTAQPSTEEPTTQEPSTEVPSTEQPTTEEPTTAQPSTEVPSTEHPSTEHPTTERPSTEVPSTAEPTAAPLPTRTVSRSHTANVSLTHDEPATGTRSASIVGGCALILSNETLAVAALVRTNASRSAAVTVGLLGTEFVTPDFPRVTECFDFEAVELPAAGSGAEDAAYYGVDVLAALYLNTTVAATGPSRAVLTVQLGRALLLPEGGRDYTVTVRVAARCVRQELPDCTARLVFLAPPAAPPTIVTAAFESGQTVATVMSISTPSVSSVSQVNRISFSAALITCEYENVGLDFYMNPLRLNLGSSNTSNMNGAVVGNTLVLVLFVLMQAGVMGVVRLRSTTEPPPYGLASLARFPSLLVLPLLFVQQSTATAATVAFMYGTGGFDYFCGVLGLLSSVGPMVCVWRQFQATPPNEMCTYEPKARKVSAVSRFFYGSGKWVDKDKNIFFKQRFSLMFGDFTNQCPWFMVVEMAMNVVCGVLQGLVHPSQCRNLLAAAFGAFLVFTLLSIANRPYNSPWRALSGIGLCVLQTTSAGCSWVGVYYSYPEAISTAGSLSVVCFYLLTLQAVVELLPKAQRLRRLASELREVWAPNAFFEAIRARAATRVKDVFRDGDGRDDAIELDDVALTAAADLGQLNPPLSPSPVPAPPIPEQMAEADTVAAEEAEATPLELQSSIVTVAAETLPPEAASLTAELHLEDKASGDADDFLADLLAEGASTPPAPVVGEGFRLMGTEIDEHSMIRNVVLQRPRGALVSRKHKQQQASAAAAAQERSDFDL